MRPLSIPMNNGATCTIENDEEATEVIEAILKHFGYDPLRDYFEHYDPSNIIIVIAGDNLDHPELNVFKSGGRARRR